MSVQYAQGEKIFAQYDYATFGYHKKTAEYTMAKSLIVTNRRVIHQEVSNQKGKKSIVRKQIPLDRAQFVDVSTSRLSKPGFLVMALIFAIVAVAAYFVGTVPAVTDAMGSFSILPSIGAGVLGVIALICLISYFSSFRTYLAVSIDVDCEIHNGIDFTSKAVNMSKKKNDARTAGKNLQLNLQVDKKVAVQIADELGAVILDAMAYVPASEAVVPEAPVVEAPVIVKAPIVAEAPVAIETPVVPEAEEVVEVPEAVACNVEPTAEEESADAPVAEGEDLAAQIMKQVSMEVEMEMAQEEAEADNAEEAKEEI